MTKFLIRSSLIPLLLLIAARAFAIPEELFSGMVRFEIERGNAFNALVLMSEQDRVRRPIDYASALNDFHMPSDVEALLEQAMSARTKPTPIERFRIGKTQYLRDNCVPALKSFKELKNHLSTEEKQEWAYYRANCFIKLGSNKRAAQAVNDLLTGIWIAHAYYNLAMAYSEASTNKTKALVALRVASSLMDGNNKLEQELQDRIHYAAGQFYLDNQKSQLASEFFKKIHLESASAPQAMYLNGVALLDQNDFRAATQSWFSVKKYPLIHSGVAEALLAIPYAYEGSGYVSQALEAYLEASDAFKKELDAIEKIKSLLVKYGFSKVMIEESDLGDLQWFLAKDVAKNTQRAAYYSYFISDPEIMDTAERLHEFKMMAEGLELWANQLEVYGKTLSIKQQNFSQKKSTFKSTQQLATVGALDKRRQLLGNTIKAELADTLQRELVDLKARVESLAQKVKRGSKTIGQQQAQRKTLAKRLKHKQQALQKYQLKIDKDITQQALQRLEALKTLMQSNFERAEQGLVHILEALAQSEKPKKNRLDRRYQ